LSRYFPVPFPGAVVHALVLGLVLAVAGCSSRPDTAFTGPVTVETSAAAEAARQVSAYRAGRGLSPVVADPALNRVAEEHARAVARAGYLSHDIGGSFASRLSGRGIQARVAAENLGAGSRDVSAVMARWRASSGHDANLLMAGAERIGFARARAPGSRYGDYWVLILAGG
jgi:uncharacterized protein YkwD